MLKSKIKFLFLSLIFSVIFACSSDDDDMGPDMMDPDKMDDCAGENISYQNDILPIINATCALSGCHVDGFDNGDYTTYAGVKEKADNGRLNSRVVVSKNMPPANSNGPKTLTDAQILAFKCWIEAGAPDN